MDIVVIGTGGLAREFHAFFSKKVKVVGFSSTNISEFEEFSLQGKFFGAEISPESVGTKYAALAIGNPHMKRIVSEELKRLGFVFPNLVHSSVITATNINDINSEGVIISPNCVIGSNVVFANHVYINFMCGIGHDVNFDNFVQVNPGAQIGGTVSIGEGVLIGSGSTVRHGLKVKKSSTVGSGSVVLSSVREAITVIGNPAKRLKIPNFDN
jgi:sugar O-acyltransferase (sialic acid O-acetyltransferase NeuD family)